MAAAAAANSSAQVSQDQFLQLMVAQLKSQDPLSPTDNGQFLAQLAQFSQLSGIEKLNTSFGDLLSLQEITQGSNLIGKTVSYKNSSGTANGVVLGSALDGSGKLSLQINKDLVPLNQVIGVT